MPRKPSACAARACAAPRPPSRNTSATSSEPMTDNSADPLQERRERIESDFARREARARAMGGPEKLARRASAGFLDARARLDCLIDPGTFVESGLFTTSANAADRERSPCDGKVAGFGKIAGRDVAVVSNDLTVFGASSGATNGR